MSEPTIEDTWDVLRALQALVKEDEIWAKNLSTFARLNPEGRVWWWRMARKQATREAPAMQKLVLKFIEIRMKS